MEVPLVPLVTEGRKEYLYVEVPPAGAAEAEAEAEAAAEAAAEAGQAPPPPQAGGDAAAGGSGAAAAVDADAAAAAPAAAGAGPAAPLPRLARLLHRVPPGAKHPVQFGREVLCRLLGCPERLSWKACAAGAEAEAAAVAAFRREFAPFDFTADL